MIKKGILVVFIALFSFGITFQVMACSTQQDQGDKTETSQGGSE